MTKCISMWIFEMESCCLALNAGKWDTDRDMKKLNEYGDTEIVCFIPPMYTVGGHG